MNIRLYYLIFLISLLLSCGKTKNIPDFDKISWKTDKNGCHGERERMIKGLLKNSQSLKGMDDDDLVEILGRPENTIYYGRGRKDYVYYIQSGSQCNPDKVKPGAKLVVEFDALGYVNIITYQNS